MKYRNPESTSSKTSSSISEDQEFEKSPDYIKSKSFKKNVKNKKYEFCPSKPEILKKYTEIEKIYQVRGFPTIVYKVHDSDQNVSTKFPNHSNNFFLNSNLFLILIYFIDFH